MMGMIATDATAQAPLACRLAPEQRLIRRLFDLPLPMREALVAAAGDTVSEVGGLFHASDVGGRAQGPSMRFVQGYRVGRSGWSGQSRAGARIVTGCSASARRARA